MGSQSEDAGTPSVVSVNISDGGIPKVPVDETEVTTAGLAGDRHDHAKHNTPLQAVSIIDREDLDDLRAEGFRVGPGATGENMTVEGLDVDALAVGDRLRLSGGVELELTKRRKPCYVLDAIDPTLKEVIVGRCGFYARVIAGGRLRPGETVEVERERGAPVTAPGDTWPHAGAILAGGHSRRMGRPKERLTLPGGRSMIEAVADALDRVCGHEVVVIGGTAALPDRRHLADLRADAGPLGGIETLLASGLDDEYLVCPCDVPLVSPMLLRALLVPAMSPMTVLRLDGEDDFRPLPARLSASALSAVREHLDAERRAVHALARAVDAEIVPAPAAWATQLTNVNTPEEYRALRE